MRLSGVEGFLLWVTFRGRPCIWFGRFLLGLVFSSCSLLHTINQGQRAWRVQTQAGLQCLASSEEGIHCDQFTATARFVLFVSPGRFCTRRNSTGHRLGSVIIDTDPGVDDAMAILLALNSPELGVDA